MKLLFTLLAVFFMTISVTISNAQSQNQSENATMNNTINISAAEEMPVDHVNTINDPLLIDVQTKKSANTIVIDGRKVFVDGQGVQSLAVPENVKPDSAPNDIQIEIPE